MKNIMYMLIGCISVCLGGIGSIMPMLPTVPFLLLAAYCFARSSKKMHAWFSGTTLYKKHLESYVKGKGMTKATKVRIMISVTILMAIGFWMMHAVVVGRIVLIFVWVLHMIYFSFGVKTMKKNLVCFDKDMV